MLKKIGVVACLFVVVAFSITLLHKEEKAENENAAVFERSTTSKTYSFNLENLSPECSEKDDILCAVEAAVKCTINPQLSGCINKNLPKFIFMKAPDLDRPTEISYKITDKKVLVNNTIEIYTESSCNGSWFGLCQGTIIYVVAQDENNKWSVVKDLYGIE